MNKVSWNVIENYIIEVLEENKVPFTGFGDYDFNFKFQDGKLVSCEINGKAKIKIK